VYSQHGETYLSFHALVSFPFTCTGRSYLVSLPRARRGRRTELNIGDADNRPSHHEAISLKMPTDSMSAVLVVTLYCVFHGLLLAGAPDHIGMSRARTNHIIHAELLPPVTNFIFHSGCQSDFFLDAAWD